jgi:hypothetical protein
MRPITQSGQDLPRYLHISNVSLLISLAHGSCTFPADSDAREGPISWPGVVPVSKEWPPSGAHRDSVRARWARRGLTARLFRRRGARQWPPLEEVPTPIDGGGGARGEHAECVVENEVEADGDLTARRAHACVSDGGREDPPPANAEISKMREVEKPGTDYQTGCEYRSRQKNRVPFPECGDRGGKPNDLTEVRHELVDPAPEAARALAPITQSPTNDRGERTHRKRDQARRQESYDEQPPQPRGSRRFPGFFDFDVALVVAHRSIVSCESTSVNAAVHPAHPNPLGLEREEPQGPLQRVP